MEIHYHDNVNLRDVLLTQNRPTIERSGSRSQVERSNATRARLVEAALDEIAERGYADFTLQRACRRAGMSTGAFQHHFETKTDLVEQIIVSFIPKAVAAISSESDADLPLVARFRSLVDRCWVLFESKIAKVIWDIYICGRCEPRLQPVIVSGARLIRVTWAREFERVLGRDLTPGADPRALALFVMTQLRGTAVLSLVEPEPGDREGTVALLTGVILSHCRDRPAAAPARVPLGGERVGHVS